MCCGICLVDLIKRKLFTKEFVWKCKLWDVDYAEGMQLALTNLQPNDILFSLIMPQLWMQSFAAILKWYRNIGLILPPHSLAGASRSRFVDLLSLCCKIRAFRRGNINSEMNFRYKFITISVFVLSEYAGHSTSVHINNMKTIFGWMPTREKKLLIANAGWRKICSSILLTFSMEFK